MVLPMAHLQSVLHAAVTALIIMSCIVGADPPRMCRDHVDFAALSALEDAAHWRENAQQLLPFRPDCVLHHQAPTGASHHHHRNLAVVTAVTEPQMLWDVAPFWATRLLYCSMHSYACIVGVYSEDRGNNIPRHASGHFMKIWATYHTLASGFTWVWYQDTDAFMTISSGVPVHYLLHRPFVRQLEPAMTSATFIANNSLETYNFLHQWWDLTQMYNFRDGEKDQAALNHETGIWLAREFNDTVYDTAQIDRAKQGLDVTNKESWGALTSKFFQWWGPPLDPPRALAEEFLHRTWEPPGTSTFPVVHLSSCLGLREGCTPPKEHPALVYHVGRENVQAFYEVVADIAHKELNVQRLHRLHV